MKRTITFLVMFSMVTMLDPSRVASAVESDVGVPSEQLAQATEWRTALGFAADQETVTRAATDPAAYPDTAWGVPMSLEEAGEVRRRVHVQLSLGPAIDFAEEQHDWAGAYIDQVGGGVPVFQFASDPTSRREEIAARLPDGMEFRLALTAHALAALADQQDAIISAADELAADGIDVRSVAILVDQNVVAVGVVDPDQATVDRLRGEFGADLVVSEARRTSADACPISGCMPTKGGIGIQGKTTAWACTVGYLVRRYDITPNKLSFITAGHCVKYGSGTVSAGTPWHHGSADIGYSPYSPDVSGDRVETYYNHSDADVGLISVSFESAMPDVRNQLLTGFTSGGAPIVYGITSVLAQSAQVVNSIVCRMGRTTSLQCGLVKAQDEANISEVTGIASVWIDHTVRYSRDADGGDSGGTMFVTDQDTPTSTPFAVLYGTHVHSDDGYVATGGMGWYSTATRGRLLLQSTHGVSLSPCVTASCGLP